MVGYSEWKIEMMKMKMPPTTVKVTYVDLMERMKRSGLCRGIRGKDAKKLENNTLTSLINNRMVRMSVRMGASEAKSKLWD